MTTGLSGYEFKLETFITKDEDEKENEAEEEDEEEEEGVEKTEVETDVALKEAKQYLTTESKDLYNHLAKVLIDLFDLRPTNSVDFFEALSLETKKKMGSSSFEYISSISEKNIETTLAKIQKKIFVEASNDAEEEETVDEEPAVKNLIESNYYFEQAGVGIHPTNVLKLFLSMKKLAKDKGLQNVRFWGKIFGLEQHYFIVEADYLEEEEDEEEEEVEEEQEEEAEEEEEEDDFSIPLPKINYKPPPEVPKEDPGTGLNKKIYFVCNDPGKLWIRLPNVTPKQIYISRKIKKFFSGRLDAPVVSYPTFPGVEINFLRAQIARISAATQVSPYDYYINEEESEEGEEIMVNPDYEPLSNKELYAAGLEGWVHHMPYILPQGRCTWWNPTPDNDEDEEEGEEEEEEEIRRKKTVKKARPQTGPSILTRLSRDKMFYNTVPWTVQLSSNLFSEDGVVAIHSNLWPGAHAFSVGILFDNVYIGTGLKLTIAGFNPHMPKFLSNEYEVFGNELTEIDDPTVEEEFPLGLEEEEEEEEEEEVKEGEGDDEDDEGDEDD